MGDVIEMKRKGKTVLTVQPEHFEYDDICRMFYATLRIISSIETSQSLDGLRNDAAEPVSQILELMSLRCPTRVE